MQLSENKTGMLLIALCEVDYFLSSEREIKQPKQIREFENFQIIAPKYRNSELAARK